MNERNIDPIEFFLAIDSISLLVRRTARIRVSVDATIELSRSGDIQIGFEKLESEFVVNNMARSIDRADAEYLLKNWVFDVLIVQPRLFLGLRVTEVNVDKIKMKIIDRDAGEDMALMWGDSVVQDAIPSFTTGKIV